jgi:hypothetical protein
MFKSVDDSALLERPELVKLAKQSTDVLAGIIRAWRDEVEVTWRPAPASSGAPLELTLHLDLWNASDSATGFISKHSFEPKEEGSLRSDLRMVWSDLLKGLSDQQMKRLKEMQNELLEV